MIFAIAVCFLDVIFALQENAIVSAVQWQIFVRRLKLELTTPIFIENKDWRSYIFVEIQMQK